MNPPAPTVERVDETPLAAPASGHRLDKQAQIKASRQRTQRLTGYTLLRWASPLILLAIWQTFSWTGVLEARTLASPIDLAAKASELWKDGVLAEAIGVSLQRAGLGFALGAVIALAIGTWVGLSRLGDALLDPFMQMVRTIPLFGLVPLFIIWFGINEEPKVYLVALGVVIPLYLNLVAALRGVDPDLNELAVTLRLTRLERVRHVLLPSVLPGTLVGLRQSLGTAWLALVVAEQVNAGAGLGYMINNARDFQQTDVIVVGLLAYAVLGLITDALVRVLERRALRWRDEGRLA